MPGHFPTEITLIGKLSLFTVASVYGVDYLSGDSAEVSWRLNAVESAMPLWLWGALFLMSGFLGFLSVLLRYMPGIFTSHLLGMTLYLALGVGVVSDVVHREGVDSGNIARTLIAIALGIAVWWGVHKNTTWKYAEITTVGISIAVIFSLASINYDGMRSGILILAVGVLNGAMMLGTASAARQHTLLRELTEDTEDTEGVPDGGY